MLKSVDLIFSFYYKTVNSYKSRSKIYVSVRFTNHAVKHWSKWAGKAAVNVSFLLLLRYSLKGSSQSHTQRKAGGLSCQALAQKSVCKPDWWHRGVEYTQGMREGFQPEIYNNVKPAHTHTHTYTHCQDHTHLTQDTDS